jgi:hypothetical protein
MVTPCRRDAFSEHRPNREDVPVGAAGSPAFQLLRRQVVKSMASLRCRPGWSVAFCVRCGREDCHWRAAKLVEESAIRLHQRDDRSDSRIRSTHCRALYHGTHEAPAQAMRTMKKDLGLSRLTLIAGLTLGVSAAGCSSEPSQPRSLNDAQQSSQAAPTTGTTLRGCVQATGQPEVFSLAVSIVDADRTRGQEPGSVVPREPTDPARQGTLGGGRNRSDGLTGPLPEVHSPGSATAWTATTTGYIMVGNGGLDLSSHVGHTVEVVGEVRPRDEEVGRDRFVVHSAKHISDVCGPGTGDVPRAPQP